MDVHLGVSQLMEQCEQELPGITERVDRDDAVGAAGAGAIIAVLETTILRHVDEHVESRPKAA